MLVAVTVGTVVTQILRVGGNVSTLLLILQVTTLLLNLTVFTCAGSTRVSHITVLKIGLAYEVAQCMVSSLGEVWILHSMTGRLMPSIWVCVLLVVYPLLIPSPPRVTLAVTLVSAATVPLGAAIVETVGGFHFLLNDYIGACVYTGVCVAIAYFGSRVVYSINRQVAEARRFGSYQLTERLGGGGMGEVWKATHGMLSRPAAVKFIRPDTLGSGETGARAAVRRFTQEAEATANLRSPHTVDIYDFGLTQDGDFYYVMEVLDGIDLQGLIDRFGPQPANRVVHLLTQACHSLHEAHLANMVHRDIKPANLFVCRYGAECDFVKVLDFGLVKEIDQIADVEDASLTAHGLVVGTPACMPPEVVIGEKEINGRADLYALGCVAYWLLTGTMPFSAESPMKVLLKHVNEIPEPPSVRSELPIPRELDQLVLSCLEKRPEDRPPDATDLSRRLKALAIEPSWTDEDARRWWGTHRPAS